MEIIALSEPEDAIDRRIRVHDDNQVEVKLDYPIDTSKRQTRYQVETYFFVPRSLGIDPHSYSREQFYSDVQAYIRFKTPSVPLAALLDPDNNRSPLTRVRRRLRANGDATLSRVELSHELRLLGCLVRANVRDNTADVRKKILRVGRAPAERRVLLADVRDAIDHLLDDVTALIEEVRALRPAFLQAQRPAWLRELFEYLDEYLSIAIEAHLTALVGSIDDQPALRKELEPTRDRLVRVVVEEQGHRRGAGYVSVIDPDGSNDHFVYRKSVLKKFMSSVLFLDMHKEKEGRGVANVVAGVAAAVAMLFATIAAIWSQQSYGMNSFPFVVAIVIAYVFKDRIKEWMRVWFSAKLGRFLSDYSVVIRDPVVDAVVGQCRESFTYLARGAIPPEILRRRHADSSSMLEPESKPEIVMKYVKDVTLHGRRIASKHGRLSDVNDIIRFNISHFLARMDEPIRHVEAFDPAQDRVREVACPKTYHVNVVMVLHADGKVATQERFRIVLDKRGIQRLQAVAPTL